MAIAFVQTQLANFAGFALSNTAGNFLVCVSRGPSTAVIADTIGNSWVKGPGIDNGAGGTYIWYALNCKGGANKVTQSGGASQWVASEFSGVALTSALDKTNAATGSGNPYASGSIGSLASANELIIGGVSNETANGQTDTPTGGFTDAATAPTNGNFNVFQAYQIISSLGAYSYGGSYSGSNSWAAAVASFVAAVTTHSISGSAGVAGATVSWTGTASGSTTADGSGNYTISSLADGSYTVTASLTGYSFTGPTPANPQVVSGADVTGVNFVATQILVATPSLSPNGGTFASGPVVVTVTDTDSALTGFAMYYTTDGTTPTTGSTPYTVPISLSVTTTLKVLAVATGYANSAIASATYTIRTGGHRNRSK